MHWCPGSLLYSSRSMKGCLASIKGVYRASTQVAEVEHLHQCTLHRRDKFASASLHQIWHRVLVLDPLVAQVGADDVSRHSYKLQCSEAVYRALHVLAH